MDAVWKYDAVAVLLYFMGQWWFMDTQHSTNHHPVLGLWFIITPLITRAISFSYLPTWTLNHFSHDKRKFMLITNWMCFYLQSTKLLNIVSVQNNYIICRVCRWSWLVYGIIQSFTTWEQINTVGWAWWRWLAWIID